METAAPQGSAEKLEQMKSLLGMHRYMGKAARDEVTTRAEVVKSSVVMEAGDREWNMWQGKTAEGAADWHDGRAKELAELINGELS